MLNLLNLKKKQCDSIDIISDPFGKMLSEVVEVLASEIADDNVKELTYNLGKWIYLIDALDDFDKDKKKKNFNVFINMFPEIDGKDKLIENKKEEIIITFAAVLNRISELSKSLNYKFNHDLTDNVLMRGLNIQTKTVMENKKCKNTTKF